MKFCVVRLLFAALLPLCFQGCTTLRSGGAPAQTYDIETDLKELQAQLGSAASINAYYNAPEDKRQDARDKLIAARLVAIDLRYMEFIKQSTSDRQAMDTANDLLVMSLGLAGASFTDATAKTILAATSSAVSGTKTTIDKNYYLEKTMPALIAAMNAQRALARLPILEGRKHSVTDYTFEQALTDLHNYYYAGTYLGAIQAIQADAGVKEAEAKKEIAKISTMSAEKIDLKRSMTLALGSLKQEDLVKAKAILLARKMAVAEDLTVDKAKEALQGLVREARNDDDVAALAELFKAQKLL